MRCLMKQLFLTSVWFVFLALSGCGESRTGPGSGGIDLWPFDNMSGFFKYGNATKGRIYIYAQTSQRGGTSYELGGQLFSSTDHSTPVIGGDMIAGGVTIAEPLVTDPSSHYTELYRSFKRPNFGSVAVFGLTGNSSYGVPAITDSLYIPSVVTISSPVQGTDVSKSQGLAVVWNMDGLNDSVLVGIEYNASLNELVVDSTLAYPNYRWWTLTNDDGSFTIPSSVMANLNVGTIVKVLVARGRSKWSGATSYPIDLYGYSIAEEGYWVIQ